jgi:hypothetical protein
MTTNVKTSLLTVACIGRLYWRRSRLSQTLHDLAHRRRHRVRAIRSNSSDLLRGL